MPEALDECQHESCMKPFNGRSIRTYACAHHCRKRLCIKHLNEHEQLIEEQTESKTQLKQAWDDYFKVVNIDTIEKQIQLLQQKLQICCGLSDITEKLLLLSDSNSSIENNQNMKSTIEMLQKYMRLENQSKPITYEIDPKNESETEDEADNESCINLSEIYSIDKHIISEILAEIQDGSSTVTTNNGGETRQAMVFDCINTTLDSSSIGTQNSNGLKDQEDDKFKILDSKTMSDGDISHDLLNHNEGKDQVPAVSRTLSIHCTTHVGSDLTDACPESSIQNTYPLVYEFEGIPNDSGFKQVALERSDSDSSSDDASSKNRSTTPELERQSSEESCY
ncbi:unnamed protein product [Rotaria socialis]|uniref:Uncharacterized protein n=1 Tax=Rotaria socialis TaxID=392032 RepID=A0A817X5D4_9BILA|nr:unnamed protein product [Rotaria socialis]